MLSAERERVAAAEDRARQDVAQFRQQAAEAVAGRQSAELRFTDLELLLSQRQTLIEDLQQQRVGLLHERLEAQHQSQTLQQDLQALRLKAEQECMTIRLKAKPIIRIPITQVVPRSRGVFTRPSPSSLNVFVSTGAISKPIELNWKRRL